MTRRDEHIDVMRDLAQANDRKAMDPHWSYGRRGFIKSGIAAAAAIAMPLQMLGARNAHAVQLPFSPDYGPLMDVADQATGFNLLRLPEGFKYWSYGWTGDVMADGIPTPGSHDGMAVVTSDPNKLVMVRNHEQSGTTGAFTPAKITLIPRHAAAPRRSHSTPHRAMVDELGEHRRYGRQLRGRPDALGLLAHLRRD